MTPQPLMENNEQQKFIPPFRIGKKQNRAVLDSRGYEVVVFPKGMESYAKEYVDFLNAKTSLTDKK